jgi:hypothetical protein
LTTSLDKPVNNANIIKELLDVWKKHRHENVSCDEIHAFPSTYAQVAKKDVNQDLFITAEKSIISSIMNRQNSRTEKRMAQPVIHQVFIIWQIW